MGKQDEKDKLLSEGPAAIGIFSFAISMSIALVITIGISMISKNPIWMISSALGGFISIGIYLYFAYQNLHQLNNLFMTLVLFNAGVFVTLLIFGFEWKYASPIGVVLITTLGIYFFITEVADFMFANPPE